MPRSIMSAAPLAALAIAALLAGCSAETAQPADDASAEDSSPSGHGDVTGAEQVAEPQSQLVSVDAEGNVGLLDLLTDETQELGTIGAPEAVASDGRYAFATTENGVEIVDGGRWSWDHGDHFHYYRTAPSLLGSVQGAGPVSVTGAPLATADGTGLFFSGSGEAVLLDNEALAAGGVSERFRIGTGADEGVVAPFDTGAVVATASGAAVHDASGAEIAPLDCAEPAGAITTRVGTVIGCAEGAVLVTGRIDDPEIEAIPYPEGSAERPTRFAGRKNRPTVAGLAGPSGFWLLDTRKRAWSHAEVDAELVDVAAADDEAGRVVALGADGKVLVFDEEGAVLGESDPLVAESLASGDAVDLVVDTQRAYLSDPANGTVYEIDYADGARVARELTTPTEPFIATELGR